MAVTPKRGYIYPNENDDDWFNVFSQLMIAIDGDVQSLFNGQAQTDLVMTKASPSIEFNGTENGAAGFRIVENAGLLYVQLNSGSLLVPIWTNLMAFDAAGNIVSLVAGSGIKVTSPDGSKTAVIGIDNDGALIVT